MYTNSFQSTTSVLDEILPELLKQKEDIILGQLGELITANLIEIQETAPVLIQDHNSNKLILKHAVKLHFKGYERIQELQKENEDLRNQLKNILGLKEKLTNE